MGKPSRYWTWLRLYSNGHCKTQEHTKAKVFFQQQFPELVEEQTIDDKAVQAFLHQLMTSTNYDQDTTCQLAETCLRCFISHQTVQVCVNLTAKYGKTYGVSLAELLPWVLDNEGLDQEWRSRRSSKPSLASTILATYDPAYGSLTTWTSRLVQQDHDLNQFLVECGLYLTSDWAILNDTNLEQLEEILLKCHLLTPCEVEQASLLLTTYHAVYREDRRNSNIKGKCADPDEAQLARMNKLLHQTTGKLFAAEDMLAKLHDLASQLRQYQTHARGGILTSESIHRPEIQVQAENHMINQTDEADQLQMEFLQAFQQEGLRSLDMAFKQVIDDRLKKCSSPSQGDRMLLALKLFYGQRQSMEEIAPQVGLKGQASVTNLLRLNHLRADVRRHMLKHLLGYVQKEAPSYTDAHHLQQLDTLLETILDALLEDLMQEDARQTKTPKEYGRRSLFAERLCQHLNQR